MNPGPLVAASARERASELARTAATRRAAVRRRSRVPRELQLSALPALRVARPSC